MSYKLVAGYGLNDFTMGEFKLLPVDITLMDLALEYDKVYFVLSLNHSNEKVTLNLEEIPNYRMLPFNIMQFLVNNGNLTLPVRPYEEPKIEKYAKYVNLSNIGWFTKSHNSDYAITDILKDELHKDLVMSFDSKDKATELMNNSLFFVDGFAVRADSANENLYLLDVRKDKNSRLYDVGCIDFGPLGGFKYVDINYENAYNRDLRENSKDVIYIQLDEDIGSGTPFLSLMGFLYIDSNVIQIVGDRTIKINLYRTEFLEKILYLMGRGQLTPEELGLVNDTAFEQDKLNSSETIETLLNNSSTFMGIINKSGVEVVSIDYKTERNANEHSIGLDYRMPVFYDNGVFCNHLRRKSKINDGYVISGNREYLMERSFNHKHRYKLDKLVDSRRMPTKPYVNPTVHGKLIYLTGD